MNNIRASFCKELHAKCYLNEKAAILTSMNLYEFSQVNNNEMGVYIEKEKDPVLYKDIYDEVQRLIRVSDEIIVSVEKAQPTLETKNEDQSTPLKTDFKLLSTTAMSKELGLSSKELFGKFESLKWIERRNSDWLLTSLGKGKGAQTKKSQYGDYIAWPESIMKEIL